LSLQEARSKQSKNCQKYEQFCVKVFHVNFTSLKMFHHAEY
jgi:hypothetical protein